MVYAISVLLYFTVVSVGVGCAGYVDVGGVGLFFVVVGIVCVGEYARGYADVSERVVVCIRAGAGYGDALCPWAWCIGVCVVLICVFSVCRCEVSHS